MTARPGSLPLAPFHPSVRRWFSSTFDAPTPPQALGWPPIARGESSLIVAPTGTGKTLAAFLWCLDRLMFEPVPPKNQRCRVLYVSPLKALAVDIERNLRLPLAGIALVASASGEPYSTPAVAIRTGDTPAGERARFQRQPADILITTPESLYLLLTSKAREALRSIDTIIIDEIHALVPTKRGAHLAISVERLAARCLRPPQRIGLSATVRPPDEVARFLGGVQSSIVGRRSSGGSWRSPEGGRPSMARSRAPSIRSGQSPTDGRIENEIAGEFAIHQSPVRYRPVTIVDAGAVKALKISVEMAVEDLAHRQRSQDPTSPANPSGPSIWPAIHSRLLELIRAHRSTLIFVNSRRLAERLAGALNELAGETLVQSHHGSIAREQRVEIENLLKAGALRGLVATSSLELGIDMGAIDLVVQIEAPPSVASGLQRIGRGSHRANAVSEGVIFPKFRGDLVACAAVARAMHQGAVEATRYPRNPLDVLAQQVVAMASMDRWDVEELFATIRRAAPFAELNRATFDGVLDMLSGRYASDEFAELRPRLTWNRLAGTLTAREGAKRIAIANGGTIPDRGLYGVFLVATGARGSRVGELDEEMVFESRVGETFVLGASTWRIEEITHDRVLVSPAPGQPGKMPFWKGDRAGRPIELGLAIGRLVHDLLRLPPAAALARLTHEHDLDERAAECLLQYLRDQVAAGAVPDDTTLVVERLRDEMGDWRICVLSPRGGRVHAPWAMAAAAKIRKERGVDVETLWGDDGFVVRYPDVDQPPDPRLLLPEPDEVQTLVAGELGATGLFAARFRENAARSLLLPKHRPGRRAPLWQQRKRATDLLAVAARHGSFPVLLETYRECLRDFFDMPALVATLADAKSKKTRVVTVDSVAPSPFAASLLFTYVANFLYDGDAPLAERRAQALSVDHAQLRQLVGGPELRDLVDTDSMDTTERLLQRLDPRWRVKSADGVHDLLLAIGDLTAEQLRLRTMESGATAAEDLVTQGRALHLNIAGQTRYVAVEDAARYRDALGVALPPGIPPALAQPVGDPLGDLALRYARTHAPFTVHDLAGRYALDAAVAEAVLTRLAAEGRLVEGEFRSGRTGREWTDAGVLRMLRRQSLARLRREVEPVDHTVLARFTTAWQGVARRRKGPDALLDVVEQLQGAPLVASILETEILPARIDGYDPADLDVLISAGEIVWVGVEPLGESDGRVTLYLTDHLARLLPPREPGAPSKTGTGDLPSQARRRRGEVESVDADSCEATILEYLHAHGASFFGPLHDALGGGYPADAVEALWNLAWSGAITNDTFHALRAFTRIQALGRRARRPGSPTRQVRWGPAEFPPRVSTSSAHPDVPSFRSRRLVPASAAGRWTLVEQSARGRHEASATRHRASPVTGWAMAVVQQLLVRYGVLTREAVTAESLPGGFGIVYSVLKTMEDAGRLRRGYFVAGLGATQFALPGALDLLRSLRDNGPAVPASGELPEVAVLAATDPANPYGATLPWPPGRPRSAGRGPTRTVGATVVLVDGALVAYLARGDRQLLVFLPDSEPERSKTARAVARALIARARDGGDRPRGMLIEEIDGAPATIHPLAGYLAQAGFAGGALGMQATFERRTDS